MPRPPLTRACLLVCICFSVITGALRYRSWMAQQSQSNEKDGLPRTQLFIVPYLTVVPARSAVFPWTFITATFVEQNIFTLVITLVTLFLGGGYLERAWGSAELGKFILVVSIVPNFLSFVVYIVWFAITGNVVRSMTSISGSVALHAGFLVAFKQLMPEHTVAIFRGIIKVRVKHIPALFLLVNTLSGPIFGTDVAAILAWLGFLASWTYLRFYKRSFPDLGSNQAPSLTGDASETFAIAYFFPDPIHRPVSIVSDTIYSILLAVRICTPFSAADVSASNSQAGARHVTRLVPMRGGEQARAGSARAEAERRRALALKALDQQLHAATNKNASGSSSGPAVLGETNLDTFEHGDGGGP